MRHFNIVTSRIDGGVELHPMKEWLRNHVQHVPAGLDPKSSTSHQLRDGLRKVGWSVQKTDTEERLIPPDAISSVIDSVMGGDAESDDDGTPSSPTFALEYQLRDFIAQNIEAIPIQGKKLKLFVDDVGRDGIEYPTSVGPIDILAIDADGRFYVFELKRGRSPDHAIGQLTRYMGWLRQTKAKDREVRGIIVAKEIKVNLHYAVSVIPNVSLFEYEIAFNLKAVGDMPALT